MGKKVKGTLASFRPEKPLALLLLITLLGGFFRLYSPNWNLGHEIHPDERNILNAVSEMRNDTGYKVSFFAYGQLPAFLYRASGELLSPPRFLYDSFRGSGFWSLAVYWSFLLVLFGGVGWCLQRGKWEFPSIVISMGLFASAIVFKFFNIFLSWFAFISGQSLNLNFPANIHLSLAIAPAVSLVLVSLVSLGVSFFVAWILENDWMEWPLYSVVGTIAVFGILPFFFPESLNLPQVFSTFSWTLMVLAGAAWFAWKSRWGRVVVGLFPLWAFFASLDHGGLYFADAGSIMVIGHMWAAVFSTLTILAVYYFVQRAYRNTPLALLASACFAFSAVSIEQAHYLITESFITLMFVVIAFCSNKITEEGDWSSYLWSGAAFGLAMAAKTSSLYYVFIILAAHSVLLAKKTKRDWEKEGKKLGELSDYYSAEVWALLVGLWGATGIVILKSQGVLQDLFRLNPALGTMIWVCLSAGILAAASLLTVWGLMEFKVLRAQGPQWLKLVGAGGLSVFLFCLFSPWSLLDFPKFMESQNYEWGVVSIADACYVLQFKDTARYFYQLSNLIKVELWWPLGLAAVLGMLWVFGSFVRDLFRPKNQAALLPLPFSTNKGWSFSLGDLLVLSWFIPYFGFIGSWNTKFIRYMAPLVPAFCIFASRLLTDIAQRASRLSFGRFVKPALWTLVVGSSLFYSLAYMHVYTHPHPWFDASVWISKNIPQGSAIASDMFDDGLPQDLTPQQDSRLEKPVYSGNYRHVDVDVYSPMGGTLSDDNDIKKNYYADTLQKADYISLATKKLWYTLVDETPEFRPRGFNMYPVSSRYFRLLWAGLLGYKMVGEFHNFPSLFGWEHPDDMYEETFSVYDHPRVYIFKKIQDVPRDIVIKLLSSDDYVKGITRDEMLTITPENVGTFIADRKKYLDDHGFSAQLDAQAPTATAVARPQAPPASLVKPEHPTRVPTVTPQAQPTPEIKVEAPSTVPALPSAQTLQALQELSKNPVVENNVQDSMILPEDGLGYQLRAWFSWVIVLILLGWMALPLTLRVLSPFPSGAYSLSKILGFFVFAWVVWFSTSIRVNHFTFASCWVWFILLVVLALLGYWRDGSTIKAAYAKWSKAWMVQECAFAAMFLLFTLIKIYIPHIHDPVGEGYNGGGEAGMDFGFLASVVRGESFPPQNMWMAGQPIGYSFYYGHLMMGVLTKFLGLAPAITYNLGLITLFALVFSGAFGLAYALSGRLVSGWIAGFLCAAAGNPDGAKQVMDAFQQCFAAGNLSPLFNHVYDYWGPTRVIPFGGNSGSTINEFPYFSVLYGDLHAHTLAMPFAMLLIGVIASLFFSVTTQPFRWNEDWLKLLTAGFLLGGITFLNTWEIPTWLVLLGIAYLVRNLSGLNPKIAHTGWRSVAICLLITLTLLGWFFRSGLARLLSPYLRMEISENALGGTTGCLAFFLIAGLLAAIVWLFLQRSTGIFSKQFLTIGLSIAAVLVVAAILWIPYFVGFHPQQNKIMWVKPDIRTSLVNYFSIHGFFLCALLFCFFAAYSKDLQNWLARNAKFKFDLDSVLEKFMDWINRFVSPLGAVDGALAMGLFSLAVIWGASWIHWVEPPDKAFFCQFLATVTIIPLALAIYFKDRFIFWIVGISAAFLWMVVLIFKGIHLFEEMPLTLDLWFFSILWLLAFFHLGLAIKTFRDRSLSFSYLLVSMFFFITATLEVFVMSEYFGFGDGMRNNSMFKYGINAWTLASICTGVFLPKIFDVLRGSFKSSKKEGEWPRKVLLFSSGFLVFVLVRCLLDSFLPTWGGMAVPLIDVVLVGGLLVWALVENWLKDPVLKIATIAFSVLLIVLSVLSMPQMADAGGLWAFAQRWCNGVAVGVLFPALLASFTVLMAHIFWEGRKDEGRRSFFLSWRLLTAVLGLSVCVYPFSSTLRKCHGFLDSSRKQWVGYAENLTLDGLAYLPRENPYDAAAIRFLNNHIPDQPCLVEFVGEGYNSWGSRFSIFSGVPALMGWDGHVREWLTGRPGMDADIEQRFQATEQIFKTSDPQTAKKYLDAYGVRLVMVGTLERNGVPGRRVGYPAEGLAKFPGFLPLIYKNPQVEIYYNPPPVQN